MSKVALHHAPRRVGAGGLFFFFVKLSGHFGATFEGISSLPRSAEYIEELIGKGIDLFVHGDDPCIVDGHDVRPGREASIKVRSIFRLFSHVLSAFRLFFWTSLDMLDRFDIDLRRF